MEELTEQPILNQAETEPDPEQEPQVEDLDFWTLSFMREHIDMPWSDINPEHELEKIKDDVAKMPEADRPYRKAVLMKTYRQRLKTFRKNMTQAQLDLEKYIRLNPDMTEDDLLQGTQEIISKNRIKSTSNYLLRAAWNYKKSHEDIRKTTDEFKEKYGDNWQRELFKELFGQYPKGEMRIDVMPITLYFKLWDPEDFALAYGESQMAQHSGGALLTKPFDKFPNLTEKILIENSSLPYVQTHSDSIKIHEEEHSIHKQLYPESAFIRKVSSAFNEFSFEPGADIKPDILNKLIDRSAHYASLVFQRGAKEEILAYLKEVKYISYIKEILTDPEISSYNYLERNLDRFSGHFVDYFLKNRKYKTKKEDGTYMSEQELTDAYTGALRKAWEKEYLPILDKALKALETIFNQYQSDPSKYPEIIRLLAQESLNKWPRLVKILR